MYVTFDKEGVLNIKPEDHSDAMTLKWFVKEFSAHGNKMINIETELHEEDMNRPVAGNSYGFSRGRSVGASRREYAPEEFYRPSDRDTTGYRDYYDRVGYSNPRDMYDRKNK